MTHRFLSALICWLLASCPPLFPQVPHPDEPFDLLVHGGTVVDGTGAPGRRADVLIRGDRVVYVGEVDPASVEARRAIDAAGKVVTPGFIDAHAHGDPFADPVLESFLAMGVTTILLGQDGRSPGTDAGEWMARAGELALGPNVALLVGHANVREAAGVGVAADPTPAQLREMSRRVERALAAGAFGLSTGLEYQPGSFAGLEELVAVAEPVGRHGGIVMSHLRSEDDDTIERSLDELLAVAARARCAVHVSHLKVVYGHGGERAEEILAKLRSAHGVAVTADVYPYDASYTGVGIVFPEWAKPPNDYANVRETRRDELRSFLRSRVRKRNGPAAMLLGDGPWSGRTLEQVAAELGKPFEDVLIDDLRPDGPGAAHFVMDDELRDRLLLDPRVVISSDGSPTMRHPRGHGAFARVIRDYVVERRLLALEEAVHKMTGHTAEILGLDGEKRGLLRAGFYADVLVFDPGEIRDAATYAEPHQLARGFAWVIVNGGIVREEGSLTGTRSGRVLRRASRSERGDFGQDGRDPLLGRRLGREAHPLAP